MPGQLPQLAQAGRIGDHRRPGVESESIPAPVVGAPARLVACLDHRRGDPGRLQPDGQRQSAEAAADHAGALALGGHAAAFRGGRGRANAATARPNRSGGRPQSTRQRSARVERAA